ncbi:MAG: ABC transporter permease [Gammaproteobacteria bacterium]|nr:ABC transporter permease [Gammaproteobacteria bacterium]
MSDTDSQISESSGALKAGLRRALKRKRRNAFLLVLPLLLFLVLAFVLPIGSLLFRSLDNPEVIQQLPNTVKALAAWDGEGTPDESVYAALAGDLKKGREQRTIGKVATRLNYEYSGARSLVTRSARKAKRIKNPPYKEALLKMDKRWGDPVIWGVIQREAAPYTLSYYLSAVDLEYDDDGAIKAKPEDTQVYIKLFWRTMWMSASIVALCFLLGYPLAYLLASLPVRTSNILMILVLLPFWTSLLVRTTTWIAVLQTQGVLNDLLVWLDVIDDGSRLQMIYNKTGTMVAMTHILLPFMILPLYSVMRSIPPSYVRAARSLGANSFLAFRRVYFPQTLAGVGAGSVLVFILSIGYYITPALVGGRTGTFITNFIAYHMQTSLNWGLAAAISSILLVVVTVLYWFYNKLVGVENVKLA